MLSYKTRLQAYGPLPDIWGEGAIFAFSGIDGPTCSASNFVLAFGAEPYRSADPYRRPARAAAPPAPILAQ